MYNNSVKTISLTQEAYERLTAWKDSGKDSFSSVVLRMVPKRGTMSDLAAAIDGLPALTHEQAAEMEKTVSWANDWRNQRDPWTTS